MENRPIDSRLVMEACIALIKIGRHDLATRVCELFVKPASLESAENADMKKTISKASMASLLQSVNLKELVEETVHLKECVVNRGNCPFCEDNSVSLFVLENHYCCDRCGAYGNAIQFLMIEQKMTLKEAYNRLSQL